MGFPLEIVTHLTNNKSADIFYGNSHYFNKYEIKIVEDNKHILWSDLLAGNFTPEDIDSIIPFDIINAIGCFLTDKVNEENIQNSLDSHDRLRFKYSFQYRNQIHAIPIVNKYILFLKDVIKRKIIINPIDLWPNGKKCAIGLSHDVDHPEKYAILKNYFQIKNMRNIKNHLILSKNYIFDLLTYIRDQNRERYWNFYEIMEGESKYGFTSTFFFASNNAFSKYGSLLDVTYNIKQKKYQDLFKTIMKNGFEIGLHASYNAYLSNEYLLKEKKRLEACAEVTVSGLRHHYWHLGKNVTNTLAMHEKCGFKYDSSIAFNDYLGFKRNVAYPYYPWDQGEQREINCLQLPVFCMDGNLFYTPIQVNDAVEIVLKYIHIIKQHRGIGVIDWHVRTSYPKST